MSRSKVDGENGASRSDHVRQILEEHPRAKTRFVIATLAEKGIKVAPSLVYYQQFPEIQPGPSTNCLF